MKTVNCLSSNAYRQTHRKHMWLGHAARTMTHQVEKYVAHSTLSQRAAPRHSHIFCLWPRVLWVQCLVRTKVLIILIRGWSGHILRHWRPTSTGLVSRLSFTAARTGPRNKRALCLQCCKSSSCLEIQDPLNLLAPAAQVDEPGPICSQAKIAMWKKAVILEFWWGNWDNYHIVEKSNYLFCSVML